MRTNLNSNAYTPSQAALSIMAGWTAAPSETWEIVKGALEDQGISDARPAPRKSLAFVPRQLRSAALAVFVVFSTAAAIVPTDAAAQMNDVEQADMSRLIEQARPVPAAGVSDGMQTLISEFVHSSIRMAATDLSGDAEAIGIVAQNRTKALAALAFHAPENLLELAAKTSALVEFTEDTERFALRMLAEDAARLAGGVN